MVQYYTFCCFNTDNSYFILIGFAISLINCVVLKGFANNCFVIV